MKHLEDDFTLDREMEMMGLQLAHKIGVAKPVYAMYKNGIAYGYATGRTLKDKDLQNPKVIQ